MSESKNCTKCCNPKAIEFFQIYKNKKGEKRYLNSCKECFGIYRRMIQKRWRENNREHVRKKSRDHKRARYQSNPEYRKRDNDRGKKRYRENETFREQTKAKALVRYYKGKKGEKDHQIKADKAIEAHKKNTFMKKLIRNFWDS